MKRARSKVVAAVAGAGVLATLVWVLAVFGRLPAAATREGEVVARKQAAVDPRSDVDPAGVSAVAPLLTVASEQAGPAPPEDAGSDQDGGMASNDLGFVVIDQDGLPLSNARVEVWPIEPAELSRIAPSLTLITDARGACRGTCQGSELRVLATEPLAGTSGWVMLGLKDAMDLGTGLRGFVIDVRPTGRVTGVVLSEEERPLAGARVRIERDNELDAQRQTSDWLARLPEMQTTDGAGRFSVEVDGGVDYRVSAAHDDASHLGQVARVEPGATVDVTLGFVHAATWLRGVARDAEGRPVEGADVKFVPHESALGSEARDRLLPLSVQRRTTHTGEFAIPLEFAVTGRLIAIRVPPVDSDSSASADPVVVSAEVLAADREIKVVFQRGAVLSGTVRRDSGVPAHGEVVLTNRDATAWLDGTRTTDARIADDGSFVFRHLHPGATFDLSYRGEVDPVRPVRMLARQLHPGAIGLSFVVPVDAALGSIRGTVLDAATDQPVRTSLIVAAAASDGEHGWDSASQWVRAGPEVTERDTPFPRTEPPPPLPAGQFIVERLPIDGEYMIMIRGEGFATEFLSPIAATEEGREVIVPLRRLGSLDVDIVEDSGAPAPWSRVTLEPVCEYPGFRVALAHAQRLHADERGHASIPDLDRGRWKLTATRGSRTTTVELSIDPEEARHEVVTLPP